MYIISIDSGTTNSRIRLVDSENFRIVDAIKRQVGVKNTAMEGSTRTLKEQLSKGIKELLENNNLYPSNIQYIVAAGMITSNLGLYEVPHVESPACLEDFGNASRVKVTSSFLNIPCIFVPGLKNTVHHEEINEFDVMRGEEVESFGLREQLNLQGKGVLVLPGSHTKYVFMKDRNITSCLSTLSGELLYAIQKDTILSSSIDDTLIKEVDKSGLLEGFKAGKMHGLTRSLYHVRLLQMFGKGNENYRANYLVGAVLSSDLQIFLETNYEELAWIVVGGANPLKKVFVLILNELGMKNVIEASDDQVELSTVIGAIEIARHLKN